MVSLEVAQRLDRAGVRWTPAAGDRFTVRSSEMVGEVFTVADMVVEAREHPGGTVLAFNGTTEWALDSVELAGALWLPLEHQVRELLGATFRGLVPGAHGYEVTIDIPGAGERRFAAPRPADAYAEALLALIEAAAA